MLNIWSTQRYDSSSSKGDLQQWSCHCEIRCCVGWHAFREDMLVTGLHFAAKTLKTSSNDSTLVYVDIQVETSIRLEES